MVRLRVYRGGLASSPEEHALDLASLDGGDTHSSPLQALHAQVYAATGVEARAQYLVYGDAAYPLQDDVDVKALLIHGDESARTVLTLLPAADVRGCVQDACSRVYFGDKPVIQPSYVIPGSEQGVCAACQSLCFPEGLLLAQVGMPLRPFVCGAAALCAEGLGTYLFEERLREAKAICGPGAGHAIQAEEGPGSTTSDAPHVLPPPALALLASFRQAAYVHQALGFQPHNPQANDIMGRLQSGRSTVLAYEAPALRNKALGIIPVATLHERAVAAGGDPQRHPLQFQDALFRELLAWFKHEFFSWTNNAPCERCGSTETTLVGGAAPTPAEQAGKAGRVEVYACPACKAHTRFPRYNDPGVLLDTRRGRCGEWANCFTLCCRALGFPARYCMDWTDHVWTEVWSEAEGRYLHADSCENACDTPLMYEAGWGKKLSYVVAFGKDQCVDVSRRYSRTFETELLGRRGDVPELVLAQQVAALDQQLRSQSGQPREQHTLQERARREQYELHHHTVLGEAGGLAHLKAGERIGRLSGNAAWKRARGEDGLGASPCAAGDNYVDQLCSSLQLATCNVPPPLATGEASSGATPLTLVERDEVAGLRLWPFAPGSGMLMVAATSIGAGDILTLGNGIGADAITLNGLPVAVGRRGLNVVVLDVAQGVVEQSVAFDAPSNEVPVSTAAVSFLNDVLQRGRVVVAVVLGAGGHVLGQEHDPVLAGRVPNAPGPGQPWLLVTGQQKADWSVAETRASGKGPVKAVLMIPLVAPVPVEVEKPSVWPDAIGALPVMHDMGTQGDGVVSDPTEAFQALRLAFPHAPLAGYSYKPGCGLVGLARASGLRGGSGWTTHLLPLPPAAQDEDPKVRIQKVFAALVAQGTPPNVAATQALTQVKQSMDAAQAPSCILVHGPLAGPSVRPVTGETRRVFDDAELASPTQAMVEGQQVIPALVLRQVCVWTSARGVLGLQAGFSASSESSGNDRVWGPVHHPSSSASVGDPTGTLTLAPEEGLAGLAVHSNDQGIETLRFVTTTKREVTFGRSPAATPATQLVVPSGWEGAALWGSVGREGLLRVGLVQRKAQPHLAAKPLPAEAWGVYTTCPVDRATVHVLHWGDKEKALKALRAARRYLENSLKDPSNAKFRLIRVRSKFFLDNIANVPGSGLLMHALGFQHMAASAEEATTEEEACYFLPLAKVAPLALQHWVGRLDVNIKRLEA